MDVRAGYKDIAFALEGPDYRTAGNGLNIEGTCKTEECVAFGKWVVCPIKLKFFQLNTMRILMLCPKCKKMMKHENIGFTGCKYTISGSIYGEDGDQKI